MEQRNLAYWKHYPKQVSPKSLIILKIKELLAPPQTDKGLDTPPPSVPH